MSQRTYNLNEIYAISKLLTCNKIKLSTWSNVMNFELLVLYTSNEDFICYNFDCDSPRVKIIPWFRDPIHAPVSIDLSPSGSFLLVLSKTCNIYILPLQPFFDFNNVLDNSFLKNSDITIHSFPFLSTSLKPLSLKLKSSSSSHNLFSSTTNHPNTLVPNESEKSTSSNFAGSINGTGNENLNKVKEILSSQCKVNPSAVCWWQITKSYQEVAIIGTMSGEIIFVDLITGVKVGEANVKSGIKALKICQNNMTDNSFLLITLDNDEQYKLTLEQKNLNYPKSEGKLNSNGGNEEGYLSDSSVVASDSISYLPSARNRLQDLKEISIEKFTSLKHKIAETRSKIGAKQGEETAPKICGDIPENVDSALGSNLTLFHIPDKGNVLAGYHAHSQLLTIHPINLDIVPLVTYKMPFETEEVVLGDRIIYVTCDKRTSLHVISSKLTEACEDQICDFNYDSVISKFYFNSNVEEKEESTKSGLRNESENAIKANFAFCDSQEDGETILNCYKSYTQSEDDDLCKIYQLEKTKEELPEVQKSENCIVVTDKGVYFVYLKSNILKIALDLILETFELEKAEKICTIFGISLQKVLELAADIKLHSLEFPTAMALYKLSKCGLLKSIVKLACGSHCSQVLNYSVILLSNSVSEMSLTERIHLSNLILMAYTQQILKNENSRVLVEKFMEFLKTNLYFDEVLAISITGQSLLFTLLHKLITYKGLTVDGYNVLLKLIERFKNSKALDWSLNKKDFFLCLTETSLTEAIIVKASSFPVYFNYLTQQVNDLDPILLERLLKLLDPTSFSVRPIALLYRDGHSLESDDSQAVFHFGKLVELFIVILLIKLHKTKKAQENYEKKLLLPLQNSDDYSRSNEDSFEFDDSMNEEMKVLKKNVKDQTFEKIKKRSNCILSCGFAHTALIRNGSLYTWGQTLKGCLGQGPSMSRYSSPSPISWLSCLRLEVFLVACGKHHTAILTNNGVYTWGCSRYGQLGLGEEVFESPYPRLIKALGNETITGLACGQFHTLAVTKQGSVFAWGWGVHGQLGVGSTDDQRYPKLIEALKEHKIVDIAAGHGHSLALSDKGQVYSFGSSIFGQLGTGTTTKYSVPTPIKGINKKVVTISTGYFHSLALTESNVLYTWGSSPQCLRFQAQGRKKMRIQQSQSSSRSASSSESTKSTTEKFAQKSPDKPVQESENDFKVEEDAHLSPSVVDTSNVTGKIIQISCGCHHSALITDSGDVYTWGRSLDGQLGNGGHREVPIPTQICVNSLKADRISCGCEFTTAQEKNTGKIFSWGSNALGQLATPIRESATKSLDGKLVMLKSCKRIVRLLDRNAALNSVDSPKEITDITPPSFSYHNFPKRIISNTRTLSDLDPTYSEWSLHYVIENFRDCINLNFILNKSLEYNNFQATSKISLLQNSKQSVIYQLKALQNSYKYQKLRSVFYKKSEEKDLSQVEPFSQEWENLFSVTKNEDQKLQKETKSHEAVKGDSVNCQNESRKSENQATNLDQYEDYNLLSQEYIEHAKYILDTYFDLNSREIFKGIDKSYIIGNGIQFWTAEKLPFKTLETLFLSRLDEISYDLGLLLFCQQSSQSQWLHKFSTLFLFKISTRVLSFIESNKNCDDYIAAMSKRLENDPTGQKLYLHADKQISLTSKTKPESQLRAIKEHLMEGRFNENYIRISYGQIVNDKNYFFSCGHHHSSDTLKEEFKIFEEISDECFKLKLMKLYDCLDVKNQVELSCPTCLRNYLKPLMNIK